MPNHEYAWTGSQISQISAQPVRSLSQVIETSGGKLSFLSCSPPSPDQLWSLTSYLLDSEHPVRAVRLPLPQVPLPIDSPLVIAALEARSKNLPSLHIKPAVTDNSQAWHIARDAHCYTELDYYYEQLVAVRPDLIRVSKLDCADVSVGLEKPDGYDATVLPSSSEVCPATSSGIMAWVTDKADTSMRRLLMDLHDPATATCSNVERQASTICLSSGADKAACHCTEPRPGIYMLDVAVKIHGEISHHRVRHSAASTLLGALTTWLESKAPRRE